MRGLTRPGAGRFLAGIGLALLPLYLAAAYVIAVDPLSLYPWGGTARLAEQYASPGAERIVNVLAESDHDTLVLGASTTVGFSPALVRDTWPGSDKVFTLAINALAPGDQPALFERLLKMPKLQRLLLALDWTQQLPAESGRGGFPGYLYNASPLDDYRVGPRLALQLARQAAADQPLMPPHWQLAEEYRLREQGLARMLSTEGQRLAAGYLRDARPVLQQPVAADCDRFTALPPWLDFIRQMTARGVQVRVFVPPYALYAYYQGTMQPHYQRYGENFLADQLLLRRCVAEALAGSGASLHAFDNLPELAEDLGNYYDPYHLRGEDLHRRLLQLMAAGGARLTPENFTAYAETLRRRVLGWTYHNSHLEPAG